MIEMFLAVIGKDSEAEQSLFGDSGVCANVWDHDIPLFKGAMEMLHLRAVSRGDSEMSRLAFWNGEAELTQTRAQVR